MSDEIKTPGDWERCTSPLPMLNYLEAYASAPMGPYTNRKARLFAVAGSRLRQATYLRIQSLVDCVKFSIALHEAELLADDPKFLGQASAPPWALTPFVSSPTAYVAAALVGAATWMEPHLLEACHVLRDIFGNPLMQNMDHRVKFCRHCHGHGRWEDPDEGQYVTCNMCQAGKVTEVWVNNADVHNLATTIYQDKDFALLPILSDLIEATGCENETVLDHLRDPGPHVRGCWILDIILGKE